MISAIRSLGVMLILLCTALVVSMFTGHNLWDIGKWMFTTGSMWVLTLLLTMLSLLTGIYLCDDAENVSRNINGWFHQRREARKERKKKLLELKKHQPGLDSFHIQGQHEVERMGLDA